MARRSREGRSGRAIAAGAAAALSALVPARAASADAPVLISNVACLSPSGCFEPGTVAGLTGSTVVWTNATSTAHNITDTSGSFYVQRVEPGQSVSTTLTQPGTYVYYCSIHGYAAMHGTIVIADTLPAPAPPVPAPQPRGAHSAPASPSAPSTASPAAPVATATRGPLPLQPSGPQALAIPAPPGRPAPGLTPLPAPAPPTSALAAGERLGAPEDHGAVNPVSTLGGGHPGAVLLLALVGLLAVTAAALATRRRWWGRRGGSPPVSPSS